MDLCNSQSLLPRKNRTLPHRGRTERFHTEEEQERFHSEEEQNASTPRKNRTLPHRGRTRTHPHPERQAPRQLLFPVALHRVKSTLSGKIDHLNSQVVAHQMTPRLPDPFMRGTGHPERLFICRPNSVLQPQCSPPVLERRDGSVAKKDCFGVDRGFGSIASLRDSVVGTRR